MKKITIIILFSILGLNSTFAQLGEQKKKPIEIVELRLKKAPRVLTFGWSVIDDNGSAFKNAFTPKSYTANLIPFTFNYDTYYHNGVYFNIKSSFCNFKKFKIVNNDVLQESNLLFALDLNVSLSLNAIYNPSYRVFNLKKSIFDFRIVSGIGYTNRNIYVFDHALNLNFGGGLYARLYDNFGMHLELMSKFGLQSPFITTNTNYMHATLGLSYFIRSVKYKDPKSDLNVPNK